MPSLISAAVIAAVAFVIPLARKLGRLPLPGSAVQIIAGVIIGPQVLGWAHDDAAVAVLSALGLAFLLLLAGVEIDVRRLRGRLLTVTAAAFALSFVIAHGAGSLFGALGLVRSPLLLAVTLSATSLGVVMPILEDDNEVGSPLGRVVVAAATLAEAVPVILLSVLFASSHTTLGARLSLLAAFLVLIAVTAVAIAGLGRLHLLSNTLYALQDTTAEVRVRGAFALLLLFAGLAVRFGLEAILGAFFAGVALKAADRDERMTHSQLTVKMQAVGFGIFIPYFFIATGMSLDVRSLVHSTDAMARIPLFLAALLLARGLPVLLYHRLGLGRRERLAAGLFQATSLSLPVVGGAIGVDLGLMTSATYVALVAAGVISVLVFPLLAEFVVRRSEQPAQNSTSTADRAQEPRSGPPPATSVHEGNTAPEP